MNSLVYLTLRTWKNMLYETLHRPAKLVLALFFIFLFGMTIISSLSMSVNFAGLSDAAELRALVLLVYTGIYLVGSWQGLSSGATFYSMADVRMLFPSPLSPKKILMYGLLRQAGTSLLLAFFLLFQYSWLHMRYGLTWTQLVVILIGFGLCFFCSNLTAMLIYSYTSADEKAQRAVRVAVIGITAVFACYVFYRAITSGQGWFSGAVQGMDSSFTALFPVAGWIAAAVGGFLGGADALRVGTGAVLAAAGAALLLVLLMRSRTDFYEDVLQATEVSYSAITARKEGRVSENMPRNIRVGRVGIGRGKGPSVFFYKNMLENRRSRLSLFDMSSLIPAVVLFIFAFFMRNKDGIVLIFALGTYMQILSVGSGRWVRELTLPYIYLIPAGAFRRLVWVCAEGMVKVAAEALVIFIPVGIIMSLDWFTVAACVAARIGFGLLLMAGNILVERVLGSIQNRILILLLYFSALILLCLPGIIGGMLVSFLFPGSEVAVALLGTLVWNVLVSGIIAFCCRDVLNVAELNNR